MACPQTAWVEWLKENGKEKNCITDEQPQGRTVSLVHSIPRSLAFVPAGGVNTWLESSVGTTEPDICQLNYTAGVILELEYACIVCGRPTPPCSGKYTSKYTGLLTTTKQFVNQEEMKKLITCWQHALNIDCHLGPLRVLYSTLQVLVTTLNMIIHIHVWYII